MSSLRSEGQKMMGFRRVLHLVVLLSVLHSACASCPPECTCSADLTEARCSNAGLTTVPDALPDTLTSLQLNDNQLTGLNASSLHGLRSLAVLHLANNSLSSISWDAFMGQLNLQELHLSHNQLTDDALHSLHPIAEQLRILDLSHNQILWQDHTADSTPVDLTISLNSTASDTPNITSQYSHPSSVAMPNLETLDLSFNTLQVFPAQSLSLMASLLHLNVSHNQLVSIAGNITGARQLKTLDLSWNSIEKMDVNCFSWLSALEEMDLSHNMLSILPLFQDLNSLSSLDISHNQFRTLPNDSFVGYSSLKELRMDNLEHLWSVQRSSFNGLQNLQQLSMRMNQDLRSLPGELFEPLSSIQTIDLTDSGLIHLLPVAFLSLTQLQQVSLAGNAFMCDCQITWLRSALVANASTFHNPDGIICAQPYNLQGVTLASVAEEDLSCTAPAVEHTTQHVRFIVSLPAVIDCLADGRPHPHITWVTPDRMHLHYDPKTGSQGILPPEHQEYHADHVWHETSVYQRRLKVNNRIHVLRNGSLYIDYVKRHDTGTYHCYVENLMGNASADIIFRLNYDSIHDTYVFSLGVGAACAAAFLLIGLSLGLVRRTVNKCSKTRNEKRNQFGQIVDNINTYSNSQFDKLNAYKSNQLGRFSDYKTAKLDQLSAFKTARVEKLTHYRKITLSNIVNHYHVMAGHYSAAVQRIHSNCTTSADKLRDHYASNVGRIKSYRSHQCEKLRDNYSAQMMRIREYGSSSLERLRDQYKTQQAHLVKLLEIMDIGNCLTVIEAECLHTESMIFDPEFNLDFALHPVHIPREGFGDSGSEYETASNSSRRPTLQEDELDFPDLTDLPDLPDLPDISEITADLYADNVILDVTSANGLPTVIIKTPKTTPHKPNKPNKRHRRRHRSEGDVERHSSQENLADPTDTQPRKRKHKRKRRKDAAKSLPEAAAAGEKTVAKKPHRSRNKSAKSVDGIVPETKNKAHVMNVLLDENTVNDDTVNDGDVSEYASAAQSREQTPKVENVTPVGHLTGSGADHVILRMENDAEHQKLTMQDTESAV